MSNSVKEIAISGGIGSGKTYICNVFEALGIPVYYSDNRAKDLVNESLELKTKIQSLLGSESYLNGVYNTTFVTSQVFNNKSLLQKLNTIIHPAVAIDYKSWVNINNHHPYLIKESAIIFELGIEKKFHKTLLITANQDLRIDRVIKRDPWRSKSEIEAIIRKQLSDSEKEKRSDYTINTNESELILPHIIKIHNSLQ